MDDLIRCCKLFADCSTCKWRETEDAIRNIFASVPSVSSRSKSAFSTVSSKEPMKIEITYNNGEKYTANLADESYENVIACILDDDSVSSRFDSAFSTISSIEPRIEPRKEPRD